MSKRSPEPIAEARLEAIEQRLAATQALPPEHLEFSVLAALRSAERHASWKNPPFTRGTLSRVAMVAVLVLAIVLRNPLSSRPITPDPIQTALSGLSTQLQETVTQLRESRRQMDEQRVELAEHKERVSGVFEALTDRFEQLSREVDNLASITGKPQSEPLPYMPPEAPPESGIDTFGDFAPPSIPREQSFAIQAGGPSQRAPAGQPSAETPQAPAWGASAFSTSPATDAPEERQRTVVISQPVTSFGLDVGSTSYKLARRLLSDGSLPPPESVRIEEFLNSFAPLEPPTSEKPFAVRYELAPSPFDADHYLLALTVKANEAAESAERKPWNLVFVINVSSSMKSRETLPLVRHGLRLIARAMRPSDRIALITSAESSAILLDSTGGDDLKTILKAIDSIHSRATSPGESGIATAFEIARKYRVADGLNRVVLVSNSDIDASITSHEDLLALLRAQRGGGVSFTALSVGHEDVATETLEQLAMEANGNYIQVDSLQDTPGVFEHDLLKEMRLSAKEAIARIEFNPENVSDYRLLGYDPPQRRGGDQRETSRKPEGFEAGRTVTALYELSIPDAPRRGGSPGSELRYGRTPSTAKRFANELGVLKLTFKAPNSDRAELLEVPLETSRIQSELSKASDDFRFSAAVAGFASKLRESEYAEHYSLADMQRLAEGARASDPDGRRAEFVGLIKNAIALKNRE